jgi:branched-chain amino acid transport system ATP-binding protein
MLSLTGIHAGYNGATVLRDITVHVPDGAVVALVGANGAGKTTLLRVATGILRPSSGSVFLDGADLTSASPNDRAAAGICYIPEGRSVFPNLTVKENLTLFGRRGGGTQPIDQVLETFPGLKRRIGQLAGTMSGGEQQMLAVGRAYLSAPKVVLLDEVSTGLAPKIVDEIFVSLEQMAAAGFSLLLVEQYVTKALSIADYVCVLAQGRLSFAGEPPEVEKADLTQAYLGAATGVR